jgi:hypothetical protein
MASQTDLDQGGTYRQFSRRWLGPSVGWVWTPIDNVLAVIATGTTTPVNGTTLITLNVAALVTIQLFNPIPPAVAANSLPGPNLGLPLTIVDIGGNCAAFNCTILPAAGKTIMGLASITIANAFGAFTLLPNLSNGNWVQE